MNNVDKAIEIFKLEVNRINEVTDSFSSTVRILELENGQKVVLKIPFNESKLIREERVLKLLTKNELVPNLIDIWYGDKKNRGALLMSYIDGEPMSLPINDELVYETGRVLARLHEIKLEMFELEEVNDDWWGSLRVRFDMWINEIKGYIPENIRILSIEYFKNIIRESKIVDGPRLVHFDFRPGNILVKNNRIVGIIDFESSRGGATDIDFTKISEYIWSKYPNSKSKFLEGYSSIRNIPDIDNHLPIYKFFNAIGGIAWCVRREKIDDDFFNENINVVRTCLNI